MSDDELRQSESIWKTTAGQAAEWPVLVFPTPYPNGVDRPGKTKGVYSRALRRKVYGQHTFDWRQAPGTSANTFRVRPEGEVRGLRDALLAKYPTDAHAVGYVLRGPDGLLTPCPRVNIGGIPWLREQGYEPLTVSWWADVDNPKIPGERDPVTGKPARVAWNDELQAESDEWMATVPLMRYAARYVTRGGQRFVWRLECPVPLDDAGALIGEIVRELWASSVGTRLDDKCFDVTRLMRLPNVVRRDTKQAYEAAVDNLDAPPLPAATVEQLLDRGLARRAAEAAQRDRKKPKSVRESVAASVGQAQPRDDDAADRRPSFEPPRAVRNTTARAVTEAANTAVPERWLWLVDELGEAVVAQGPQGAFHDMMLKLAGALLWRGIPGEAVPPLIAAIAERAGSKDPGHHRESAVHTILQAMDGDPVSGMPRLAADYPVLARAVQIALSRMKPPTTHKDLPTVDAAFGTTAASLADTQALARGIRVRPGVGKTTAACAQAVENARQHLIHGGRDYRTAISVPTHELAIQVVADIKRMGVERGFDVPVARLFSPASMPGPNKGLECRYPDFVRMLAATGASVQREACEGRGTKHGKRCDYYDSCRARPGMEGDEDPSVLVATHAKIKQLAAHAGARGLLIIDEPGSMTEDKEITAQRLTKAANYELIEERYILAMRPLAFALRNWLESYVDDRPRGAPPVDPISLTEAAQLGFAHPVTRPGLERVAQFLGVPYDHTTTEGELIVRNAAAAFPPDDPTNSTSCPVLRMPMQMARSSARTIAELEPVIGTFNALYEAAVAEAGGHNSRPALWVVVPKRDDRHVLIKRVNKSYDAVLRLAPERRMVFMDANLDAHVPIIEWVTGERLPVVDVTARDAVTVERTIWMEHASRKRLLDEERQPNWAELVPLFDRLGGWLASAPVATGAGIVTFKPIALPLAAAMDVATDKQLSELAKTKSWEERVAAAKPCAEALRARWGGDVRFGHFGALRGLNSWKHLDAIVSLGDPRPNIDAVQREVQYLSVESLVAEERYVQLVRDELEQVHERLRAVRRTAPCKELHAGEVTPGGVAWQRNVLYVLPEDVEAEKQDRRRREVREALEGALRATGSMRELARRLSVDPKAVRKWAANPPQAIPTDEHVQALRALCV